MHFSASGRKSMARAFPSLMTTLCEGFKDCTNSFNGFHVQGVKAAVNASRTLAAEGGVVDPSCKSGTMKTHTPHGLLCRGLLPTVQLHPCKTEPRELCKENAALEASSKHSPRALPIPMRR
jgi:hypothetical protein